MASLQKTKLFRYFAHKIQSMLQRIQTVYLAIFIILSALMLSGISVLQLQAKGTFVEEPIFLKIGSTSIEGYGKLKLTNEVEIQEFADNMKNFPFSFNPEQQKLSLSKPSPLLIFQILITICALMTFFGYKNLKKQLTLSRITFFLTLLYVLVVMAMVYLALDYANPYIDKFPLDDLVVSQQTNLGFYLICAMLPLAYLAQMGIKRDLNLIKSVDRLR